MAPSTTPAPSAAVRGEGGSLPAGDATTARTYSRPLADDAVQLPAALGTEFVRSFPTSLERLRIRLAALSESGAPLSEGRILQMVNDIESGISKPQVLRSATARKLNDEGIQALNAGDAEKAVVLFRNAYVENPTDVEITENLGYANLKKGKTDDAEKELTLSILMSPRRASSWGSLGHTLAERGDVGLATACLATAFCVSRSRDATKRYYGKLHDEDPNPQVRAAADEAQRIVASPSFFAASVGETAPDDLAARVGSDLYGPEYLARVFGGDNERFRKSLSLRLIDLNSDGVQEYVVLPTFMCGSAGCDLLIYERHGGSYARLFGDSDNPQNTLFVGGIGDDTLRIAPTTHHGYSDLQIGSAGTRAILTFDGQQYHRGS